MDFKAPIFFRLFDDQLADEKQIQDLEAKENIVAYHPMQIKQRVERAADIAEYAADHSLLDLLRAQKVVFDSKMQEQNVPDAQANDQDEDGDDDDDEEEDENAESVVSVDRIIHKILQEAIARQDWTIVEEMMNNPPWCYEVNQDLSWLPDVVFGALDLYRKDHLINGRRCAEWATLYDLATMQRLLEESGKPYVAVVRF